MAEIIPDGTTGFIQSFRDPRATAALPGALWEDEARYAAMRRTARGLFDRLFSEKVVADRLALLQATILDLCRDRRM